MTGVATTGERADSYVRHQAMWQRLLALFRVDRPTDEQCNEVSTVAEVAIDQVFSAYSLTEEQCRERFGLVKDYAECAALYGWVAGYARAKQEIAAQAGD